MCLDAEKQMENIVISLFVEISGQVASNGSKGHVHGSPVMQKYQGQG